MKIADLLQILKLRGYFLGNSSSEKGKDFFLKEDREWS